MNYVVLGAGLQGPSVAYALRILEPKSMIWLVEKDKARLDRASWLLKKLEVDVITIKTDDNFPILESFRKRSNVTVISTLPFSMNYGIAIQCVKMGWRYYDLGGHIQTSEKIALMAMSEDSQVPVMTDLGLAPGLVNILGEHAVATKFEKPIILQMMCGGLPVDPFINELNYGIVFSPEGLINEYFNDCYILDGGKIRQAEPMGDLATVVMNAITYEAFNTSGGAHTTLESVKKKGVKFCSYKTIRYLGHSKVIRFLRLNVGMTTEQICSLIKEKIQRISQDKVLIGISVSSDLGAKYMVDYEIGYDDNFTAMQKATGFSIAAIVVQTKDASNKSLLTYSDVDPKKLVQMLGHKKLLPEIEL